MFVARLRRIPRCSFSAAYSRRCAGWNSEEKHGAEFALSFSLALAEFFRFPECGVRCNSTTKSDSETAFALPPFTHFRATSIPAIRTGIRRSTRLDAIRFSAFPLRTYRCITSVPTSEIAESSHSSAAWNFTGFSHAFSVSNINSFSFLCKFPRVNPRVNRKNAMPVRGLSLRI